MSSTTTPPRLNFTKKELQDKKYSKTELIDLLLETQSFTTTVLTRLEDVTSKLHDMSQEISTLKDSNNFAESLSRMETLERDSYSSQQYSRRDTIEIVGIPETVKSEDLEAKSIEILKNIDVTVEKKEIQACHRIGKKHTTIIKFVNRKSALECLSNKSRLKELDKSKVGFDKNSMLFINESLCYQYRRLFGICNSMRKENKIKKVWTYNGSIKICLNDDSIQAIGHKNDLVKLSLL